MDEKALTELLECSVCLDQLDHTSKVLPCQHTFCKHCLDEIYSTKHELRCPECRFLVEMHVEDLPTNILLIRLLEGLKSKTRGLHTDPSLPGPSREDKNAQTVAFARQQQQRQGSSSSRPCAKVLFNFDGQEECDLTLKKGDIVYLRKKVDEHWFHGELNGNHGFFPATYVKVITPLPTTIPQCKGMYDFNIEDNKEGDCLSFKKDDVVTVIRKVDGNWLEGKKGDKIGIFPISFVELNDPAKILLQMTEDASTSVGNKGPPVTPAHPISSVKDLSPSRAPSISSSGSGQNLTSSEPARPSPHMQQNKRHSLTNLTQNASPSSAQRRSLEISPDTHMMTMANASLPTASNNPALPSQSDSGKLSVPPAEPAVSTNKPEPQVPVHDKCVPVPESDKQSAGSGPGAGKHLLEEALVATPIISEPPGPVYVSLYNYKPQKPDEIELRKGDYYSVSEKCQDGWYKGQCMKTGVAGVFPGNYVQSVKTLSSKPAGKCSGNKNKSQASSSQDQATSSKRVNPCQGAATSRLKTSAGLASSVDQNRSAEVTGRSDSTERETVPPPVGPRTKKMSSPHQNLATSKGSKSSSPVAISSSSSTVSSGSPIMTTSAKTTRYVRVPKSGSPNSASCSRQEVSKDGAKSLNSTCPANSSASTSAASPVWKHSLSTSTNITPPNVSVGGTGKSSAISSSGATVSTSPSSGAGAAKDKDKKEKKEKEKLSLMKRLTVGKSKKSKYSDEAASLSDSSVSHSRSGSYPSEMSALPHLETNHKKSGSFDSSSQTCQSKPSRPKPLLREKYRCVETYPPQSEIELDLKIGDIIYVHKKRDDGWYKGTLQRSGKTGLFPSSFAEKCD